MVPNSIWSLIADIFPNLVHYTNLLSDLQRNVKMILIPFYLKLQTKSDTYSSAPTRAMTYITRTTVCFEHLLPIMFYILRFYMFDITLTR